MIAGVALFLGGAVFFMALLFGSGGVNRAHQFSVIGRLLSGGFGPRRRALTFLSLVLLGVGMCTTFAGVASMDAERARRCREHCAAQGYPEGHIGPSIDREPATRFVACTCTGGSQEALELRADSLR
jgi:hypothetical protein